MADEPIPLAKPVLGQAEERAVIDVLRSGQLSLGPKLGGKLHVYTGSEDTFYLDGAVVLLKESLAKLGSDAVQVACPGWRWATASVHQEGPCGESHW